MTTKLPTRAEEPAKTWRVNTYTARWIDGQFAPTDGIPAIGDSVRVHVSCDAREWDDLQRRLRGAGRALEWSDGDGPRWNVYRVVKRPGEDEG
jgi:hypothetical protein